MVVAFDLLWMSMTTKINVKTKTAQAIHAEIGKEIISEKSLMTALLDSAIDMPNQLTSNDIDAIASLTLSVKDDFILRSVKALSPCDVG